MSKLTLSIQDIQMEGINTADFLKKLAAMKNDLEAKGIETSIRIGGLEVDELEVSPSLSQDIVIVEYRTNEFERYRWDLLYVADSRAAAIEEWEELTKKRYQAWFMGRDGYEQARIIREGGFVESARWNWTRWKLYTRERWGGC